MVIGLHGKMGAGKNECARRLALLSELSVVEVSFAWKLKQSFAALFDIPTPVLESWKNDRDVTVTISRETWGATDAVTSQTVRSALQRYGTEAHRDIFGADFWLDAALPYRDTPRDNGYQDALYVVTDVRFPNEAEWVNAVGGRLIRVTRPGFDSGIGTDHPSEAFVDSLPVDIDIVNDGSIGDLEDKVVAFVAGIRPKAAASFGFMNDWDSPLSSDPALD